MFQETNKANVLSGQPLMICGGIGNREKIWRPFSRAKNLDGLPRSKKKLGRPFQGTKFGKAIARKK